MRKPIKPKIISKPRRNGKLRPKDEAFCRAIAYEGRSGAQAYREHIAVGPVSQGTAQVGACRLLQAPNVRLRLEQLQERDKRAVEERIGVGRDQLVAYLVDAYQTPLSEIDETSPLAQSVKRKRVVAGDNADEAGEWEIEEIKSVSRLDAVEKLAKMLGLYPQTSNGSSGAIPAITINLGAMYSPAQSLGEGEPRTTRTIQATVKTIAG